MQINGHMRGMIKWKPFNTLINNKDILEISNSRLKETKPIIMEDKILEINSILTSSIKGNLNLEIKYWHINSLKTIIGTIKKINKNEKYILVSHTRIYFKDIINIKTLK